MSNVVEIEAAIERLPLPQKREIADWLAERLGSVNGGPPVEAWLQKARGAATQKVTTDEIMALTRGEA